MSSAFLLLGIRVWLTPRADRVPGGGESSPIESLPHLRSSETPGPTLAEEPDNERRTSLLQSSSLVAAGESPNPPDEPWQVLGTVHTNTATDWSNSVVHVVVSRRGVPNHRWSLRTTIDAYGTFHADVSAWLSELFTYRRLDDYSLRCRLEHPSLYAEPVDTPIEPLRSNQEGMHREIRVKLSAKPGIVLSGVVQNEWGLPIDDAQVLLLSGAESPPRALVHDRTNTLGDGSFGLWLRQSIGTSFLLFVATGYSPRIIRIGPFESGGHNLGVVILANGAVIEGRILNCQGNCVVEAYRVQDGAGPSIEFSSRHGLQQVFRGISWGGDRPFRWYEAAVVDPDGSFRIDGLDEGRYEVRISHRSEEHTVCVPGGMEYQGIIVKAPVLDLALYDEMPWVQFFIHSRGQALPDATVQLEGHAKCNANWNGVCEWMLVPNVRAVFLIESLGYKSKTVQLSPSPRSAPPQRISVELLPSKSGGILLSTRDAHTHAPIDRVSITIVPELSPEKVFGLDSTSEAGRHELGGLEPGRYWIKVSTQGPWNNWQDLRMPATTHVQVDDRQTSEHALEFDTGGQVTLQLREPGGAVVAVDFELMDASGVKVNAVICSQKPLVLRRSVDRSLSGEPGVLIPPLLPGKYSLLIADDRYHSEMLGIEVVKGQTTVIEAVVLPR